MAVDGGLNQSVGRAVSLLHAFTAGRPELRVSDVARLTGNGQSTVSRMLATLEQFGLVERDPVSGLFRLGLDHLTFATVALNNHPVHREGRQVVQELAHRLGLGANLSVRRGTDVFYLANFEGRLAPKTYALAGKRNPLHATAMGKCLLLALTPAERRELLGPLTGFTANTVTEHDALDAEVERVATTGYAVEIEELALGRACLAVPIRDGSGGIAAAMSVSGPLSAIDLARREQELAGVAIEAADAIGTSLGYVAGPYSPLS